MAALGAVGGGVAHAGQELQRSRRRCDAPGISEALTQNYTKASDELGLNHA